MRVVIDTCVWSFFLRRKPKDLAADQKRLILQVRQLIGRGQAVLTGVVRQELLTGMQAGDPFDQMCEYLRYFDDEVPEIADHEQAARFDNRCRTAGIAGSAVDMLICAIAERRGLPILTTDHDFQRYARVFPLHLRAT
jgi:predicted nucleic acid-binding protein